jgi:DNA-binding NarL/FixJ family response regulator
MRNLIKKIIGNASAHYIEYYNILGRMINYELYQPDIVIVSVKFYDQIGLEEVRHIKKSFPNVRIIVIADCEDERLRAYVTEAGAYRMIAKDSLYILKQLLGQNSTYL